MYDHTETEHKDNCIHAKSYCVGNIQYIKYAVIYQFLMSELIAL